MKEATMSPLVAKANRIVVDYGQPADGPCEAQTLASVTQEITTNLLQANEMLEAVDNRLQSKECNDKNSDPHKEGALMDQLDNVKTISRKLVDYAQSIARTVGLVILVLLCLAADVSAQCSNGSCGVARPSFSSGGCANGSCGVATATPTIRMDANGLTAKVGEPFLCESGRWCVKQADGSFAYCYPRTVLNGEVVKWAAADGSACPGGSCAGPATCPANGSCKECDKCQADLLAEIKTLKARIAALESK